jgi:hypothetical protein
MTVHQYYEKQGQELTRRGTTMSSYLTLEANQPEAIALKYSEGLEVDGRWGPQIMFTLTDERKWYASPAVADMIAQMGIRRGERFEVCKRASGKTARHEIKRIQPPAEQPGIAAPAAQQAGITPSSQGYPITVPASVVMMPSNGSNGHVTNGHSNGHNGHQAPPAPPAAPLPAHAPWLLSGEGQHILAHYTNAVDLAIAVQKYAAANGMQLAFSAEDIRAIAATSRIEAQKGGPR